MYISMLDMLINLLRQNWNLPFCFKSHILYFAFTPKCKCWVQTDNRPKIFNFFNKFFNKFLNSNCHCHIGIQNEKCIQMNTNKPSIGSVVLDIPLEFGENILNSDFNFCKLKLKPACKGFLDCTETSCGLQIACRLGSVSKILGIPILIFRGRASNFWNSPMIGPIFSIHWGTTCSDLRKKLNQKVADLIESLSGLGTQSASLPTTDYFAWTVWSTWIYHHHDHSQILVILSSKPVAKCIYNIHINAW